MKNNKCYNVETVPKSNRKIVETCKIYSPNIYTWALNDY